MWPKGSTRQKRQEDHQLREAFLSLGEMGRGGLTRVGCIAIGSGTWALVSKGRGHVKGGHEWTRPDYVSAMFALSYRIFKSNVTQVNST